jgi:hypothetical protein
MRQMMRILATWRTGTGGGGKEILRVEGDLRKRGYLARPAQSTQLSRTVDEMMLYFQLCGGAEKHTAIQPNTKRGDPAPLTPDTHMNSYLGWRLGFQPAKTFTI